MADDGDLAGALRQTDALADWRACAQRRINIGWLVAGLRARAHATRTRPRPPGR